MKTPRHAIALTLFIVAAAGPVHAGTIGVDDNSGSVANTKLSDASKFSMFREAIANAGHTIVPVSAFSAASLGGLDALILRQPYESSEHLASAEIAAIHSFVGSGGNLLVIGEAGYSSSLATANINAVLLPYGLTFGSSVLGGSGHVVTSFHPHELTAGVTEFGLYFYRPLSSIVAPAFDLTGGSTGDDVYAVAELPGSGVVVVVSDASCWTNPGPADWDITDWSNARILDNILDAFGGGLTFGDGCPGAGGFVPKLATSPAQPAAGTVLNLAITDGLGGSTAILLLGLNQGSTPLGAGCTLHVGPVLPATLTVPLAGNGPGNGNVTLFAPLPSFASGFSFTTQAFILDAASPIGASATNGALIAIQ